MPKDISIPSDIDDARTRIARVIAHLVKVRNSKCIKFRNKEITVVLEILQGKR